MEIDRLNFIIQRDGLAAAYQFAVRTYSQYRTNMKQGGHLSTPMFRRGAIESCLTFRKFIRENKDKI